MALCGDVVVADATKMDCCHRNMVDPDTTGLVASGVHPGSMLCDDESEDWDGTPTSPRNATGGQQVPKSQGSDLQYILLHS